MSRTVGAQSKVVTLLKVKEAKVCEVKDGKALVAYSEGKSSNKSVEGQQKKYNLSAEFNKFATLAVANTEGAIWIWLLWRMRKPSKAYSILKVAVSPVL